MCLAAVRENGDALPYSELFDVNRLQEFMRTSTHMGDKASGGNRVVTVVERAPPWMQGRRYWDGSDKKAPTLIGSKCSAIAGQRMRSEVDNVLPQAMMVHGASTLQLASHSLRSLRVVVLWFLGGGTPWANAGDELHVFVL